VGYLKHPIVTISDIEPYESLKDFTAELGNYCAVGQHDNIELIITMSKNKRNIWIGTGLGMEKILTDEKIQYIIDTEIIPYFRKEEYFLV